MTWTLHEFASRPELDESLAGYVAGILRDALEEKGKASIAVSGGSTPAGFFDCLSRQKLAWDRVTVTLADDRCVPADSPDSNAALVSNRLIQNQAIQASFMPLYQGLSEVPDLSGLEARFRSLDLIPLDIVVLGMGTDGHTASLFPCAPTIELLMQEKNPRLFYSVNPTSAPWKRITFSLPALLQARRLILHLVGEDKRAVLEKAVTGEDSTEMPIRAFLLHPEKTIDIYWAP